MIDLYHGMLKIRRVEEAIAKRYSEWRMRCPTHLSIGQEGVAIGVCHALSNADILYSNHRDHAHYLAKGGDLNAMIAELHGKATGCCGGRGGSMHLIDKKVGFAGSAPIVGATVPLAVGAAFASKLRGDTYLGVTFFGDGCFEEGVTHECLNFAAMKKLPILFICENNLYSVYTQLKDRQPQRPIHDVARAQGWQVAHGDGNDVEFVYHTTREAVARLRRGEGPQFLEFSTYRWLEHCGPFYDDDLGYRPQGELKKWQEHCPLHLYGEILSKRGILNQDILTRMEAELQQEIDAAFDFAINSPAPEIHTMADYIYAK